ncbi:MAG: tetratricopeptide repeat protein [Cyanobacteria bacterium SZAS LIN-2]|nr:tetratricopeptide repeat protein [Cyanobacteria bacterium SZAS LIN-2]
MTSPYHKFFAVPLSLSLALATLVASVGPSLASETPTLLEKILAEPDFAHRPSQVSLAERYIKEHPHNPDMLGIKARYLLSQGKIAQSIATFKECLALAPTNARAYEGLSFCLIEMRDYKGAFEAGLKAFGLKQLDPIYVMPDSGFLANMCKLASKLGRTADAARFTKELKYCQDAAHARTLREQGVLDQSLLLLDKMLKENPSLAYAHLLRGVVYNNKSEHQKAIKDFDAVIALQPTLTTPYYLRGDSYFELNNKVKALESWKQSLAVRPVPYPGLIALQYTAMTGRNREHFEPNDMQVINAADIHYLCGVAETDLRRYADAAKDFGQCIAIDGTEYKAYFSRAVVNERLNRDDLALVDLNHAIKLNNKYIEALFERAKLYEKRHENALAMADYSTVINFNPGDLGALVQRAELAVRIKNYDQALADYNQAIRLSPTEDDPLMGRAKVYTLTGRYDMALADYKKAMRLNPQDKGVVLDAIARVEKLKKNAALSAR